MDHHTVEKSIVAIIVTILSTGTNSNPKVVHGIVLSVISPKARFSASVDEINNQLLIFFSVYAKLLSLSAFTNA